MNINSVTGIENQTAFGARIRMKKPNIKALTQVALGSTALAAGAATAADGLVSTAAMAGPNPSPEHSASVVEPVSKACYSLPESIIESHEDVLASAGPNGFPVQSSILPTAMPASGLCVSTGASKAFINAEKNGSNVSAPSELASLGSEKSVVSTKDFSVTSSGKTKLYSKEHPNLVPSIVGSSMMSSAAAGLYELQVGGNPVLESINSEIPKDYLPASTYSSGVTGGLTVSTASSNTKSGKASGGFISETFSDGKDKTDKKLPS